MRVLGKITLRRPDLVSSGPPPLRRGAGEDRGGAGGRR